MSRENTIIYTCEKIEALNKVYAILRVKGESDFEKRLCKLVHLEIIEAMMHLEKAITHEE